MAAVRSTMKLFSGTLGLSSRKGGKIKSKGSRDLVEDEANRDECKLAEEEEKACDRVDLEEAKLCEPEDLAAKLAAAVDDWEILSEKSSIGGNVAVFVSQSGSVRSIAVSIENAHSGSVTAGGGTPTPTPTQLKQLMMPGGGLNRSPSNSTIASEDCCSLQGAMSNTAVVSNVGPSAHSSSAASALPFHGLPGVDYVEHVVLPTDTLQGICLAYKISATRLRQANRFSGTSLLGAPKKLVVPLQRNGVKTGAIRMQDRTTKEFKICAFLAEEERMVPTEAESYLEQTNWILEDALLAARADHEWENSSRDGDEGGASNHLPNGKLAGSSSLVFPGRVDEHEYDDCSRRSGDIRVTLRVSGDGVPISATVRAAGCDGTSAGTGSTVPIGTPRRKNRTDVGSKRNAQPTVVALSSSAVNQTTCSARDILDAASGTRHYDGRAIELRDLSS